MSNIEDNSAGHIDGRSREARATRAMASGGESLSDVVVHADGGSVLEIMTPGGKRITRENRRPFGSQSQKLAVEPREGYFRYWANDTPGRIAGMLESGYTHVIDPLTKKNMSLVVGVAATGGPLTAYLLELPQEWRNDDMAQNEKVNFQKEEALRRGPVATKSEDQNGFYPAGQSNPNAPGTRISIARR